MTLAELISRPDRYHGKSVWVVAKLSFKLEHAGACPAGDRADLQQCLWLRLDPAQERDENGWVPIPWKPFDDRTVAVLATFDKAEHGHLGLYPGGLHDIRVLSGHRASWRLHDGTSRDPCAPALPPETPQDKILEADYEGAIADFDAAAAAHPDDSFIHLQRAHAKRRKGDGAGALQDYARAIDLFEGPDKSVGYWQRGIAWEEMGEPECAIADYTRALDADPGLGDARSRRDRLSGARSREAPKAGAQQGEAASPRCR